ncbi:MAG: response regulator [Rhodospirillales bacterium]
MRLRSYDLSQLRVLIIDDNKHMQLMIKEILRSFNIRMLQTADDGADALKLLKTYSTDLIICDWNMAPLDGIAFVEMVRKSNDSTNPEVTVIMLTGHTEYNRVMAARDAGVNTFLAKPVSPSALYARIVHCIEDNRLFIRNRLFYGPDRRRAKVKLAVPYKGPERRSGAGGPPSPSAAPSDRPLTQAEVEALLGG